MLERKTKQPSEVLDFDFDGVRKIDDTDAIIGATANITGPDNALTMPTPVTWTDVRAKVWLAGGTDGAAYKITADITTAGGRKFEKEFMLFVKDR